MSNELPPRPTEMCEPVIAGFNILHQAIDDYWESKYPTYAKGRIKRMRGLKPKSTSEKLLEWAYKYWNQNKQFHYHITRWNRH